MLTKLTEEEKSKLRTPSEVTQLMTVSMSVVQLTPKVARAKYVFVLSSAELNQLDLKPILSESV